MILIKTLIPLGHVVADVARWCDTLFTWHDGIGYLSSHISALIQLTMDMLSLWAVWSKIRQSWFDPHFMKWIRGFTIGFDQSRSSRSREMDGSCSIRAHPSSDCLQNLPEFLRKGDAYIRRSILHEIQILFEKNQPIFPYSYGFKELPHQS